MALPDRALQVLDLMLQSGVGQRPLLFICHSLGGLVAKQILRKAVDASEARKNEMATNTRAVLFLATPHAGATLASLLNAFRAVFRTTFSIDDLRAHDAHLRDLFDWYRNHASRLGIQTVTYFESRGVNGVVPIVNPTSAHPGTGADPVGLDEDHLSIAKPRVPNAQVCGAARTLLWEHIPALRAALKSVRESCARPAPTSHYRTISPVPDRIADTDTSDVPVELHDAADGFPGPEARLTKLIAWLDERRIAVPQNPRDQHRRKTNSVTRIALAFLLLSLLFGPPRDDRKPDIIPTSLRVERIDLVDLFTRRYILKGDELRAFKSKYPTEPPLPVKFEGKVHGKLAGGAPNEWEVHVIPQAGHDALVENVEELTGKKLSDPERTALTRYAYAICTFKDPDVGAVLIIQERLTIQGNLRGHLDAALLIGECIRVDR